MTSLKLLLLVAVVACYLVQQGDTQACTETDTTATCTLPVTFFDHAPAWMAHSRWNPKWWHVNAFYDYPSNGSCGTANNTYGWANSDFELPLPVLQDMPCCSGNYDSPIIEGEQGLVGPLCTSVGFPAANCGRLNLQTLTPQYAYPGASPLGQVSSPESFATFFNAVEETFVVPSYLTLTQDPQQSTLRSFNNFSFWPLDGLGWNDHNVFLENGTWHIHNFAFCMVLHTHFTYQGGEYFNFLGDDDVYVYIGGYLVIDLGGVHTAQNASISADKLNLTLGNPYRFDMFYCERHTVSSEIRFETTIGFYCPYTDWCGVCDGSGSTCCNGACDDNDLCTIDSCTAAPPPAGCNNTKVVCPPSTSCLNSFCDPTTGNCTTTPVNCDDNNNCTTDSCGPGGCSHLPISCAVSDKCVTTGCNPSSGCYTTPITCPNTNQCLSVSCNSSLGCISNNIPCTTTNKCETALCSPSSGCKINPIPVSACNDSNVCTIDSCNNQTGCMNTPMNITSMCGVSDKCTQWSCDPVKGCQKTTTNCTSPDACHTAICIPAAGCSVLPNVTCSGNACGSSACNPTTGACVYTPNAPCSPRTCYNATCNNSTGCQYSPATCASTQSCYTGVCINNQCNFTYTFGAPGCGTCGIGLTCNDSDPCNPQVCENGKCVNQPVNCNDYNACTNDTCVATNGKAQCVNTPVVCSGGNPCNPQSCSNGQCVSNPVTCDDGNPCTINKCEVYGSSYKCDFPAIQCNASSDPFCNPVECQNGTCVNAPPPNCSDGNSCTFDECTNGSCSNPPVCPSAGTLCDPITCVNGTCVTQPVNCSSGNLCSIDSCDPATGNCLHVPKNCNGTICLPSSCNLATGQCEVPPLLNCNDNNPCTLDAVTCDPINGFGCNNTDESYLCDSNSACILDFCNSSLSTATNVTQACYHQNVTCTAPTICQVVAGCDAKNGCVYVPKVCPAPADWCQVAFCDETAGCITVARACAPQDNFCFSGVCNNATKTCSQQQRPNWQTITNQQGVTCLLAYNTAAKAGLTAGIIAAIVIAAVVAAALIAVAGKKGVDIFMASRAGRIVPAGNNPLYVQSPNQGTNPTYKDK